MKPSVDSFTDEVRVLNVISPLSDWIYHHLWPNLLHRSWWRHFKSKSALTIVEKLVVRSKSVPPAHKPNIFTDQTICKRDILHSTWPFLLKTVKVNNIKETWETVSEEGSKDTEWQHVVWLPRSDVTIGKKGHCVQGGDVGRSGVGELLPRLCEAPGWVSSTGEGWERGLREAWV